MKCREVLWLLLTVAMAFGASGAFAAVAAADRTLLDVQWVMVLGTCGLTMVGGVCRTLISALLAAERGERLPDMRLHALANLSIAVVLGFVGYGVSRLHLWPPEQVVAVMPFVGAIGRSILNAAEKHFLSRFNL